MISIDGKNVIINSTVLLNADERSVEFKAGDGLVVRVLFRKNATEKASISPSFSDGAFILPLTNFGNPLGMAVSGKMTASTASGHRRPGTWYLTYAVSVQDIGESFKSLHLTVAEERVA
ncbi:hypothetical protein HNR59_002892 [Aquamicrobium lusatiense]|uniref:Uncharacterized protein n=1 Tax=Aquamicrobium lusatiense TaxID=89772 RepID=A0A7W9VVX8_9HYPH|nr:hypothetical protein [Aquamicrobium lusatiense]MBB6013503.1 hypothetical protein [Aquamicrobium lusatiense]